MIHVCNNAFLLNPFANAFNPITSEETILKSAKGRLPNFTTKLSNLKSSLWPNHFSARDILCRTLIIILFYINHRVLIFRGETEESRFSKVEALVSEPVSRMNEPLKG